MIVADHPFAANETSNPRLERCCAVCSRIPEAHPAGRNLAIEESFMNDVSKLVAQMRGMSYSAGAMQGYRRKVTERLAIGDERYGPVEFLNRDCLVEVEEETPDIATYGLLEVERLQREGMNEQSFHEVRSALVTAAAYAAIADEWVHIARLSRDAA